MPKTVQIRDIDDDVYQALAARAAEARMSVPELLRREAERVAARPSVAEWLARTRRRAGDKDSPTDVVSSLDESRGPWPT